MEFVAGEPWPIQRCAQNVETGFMANAQKQRELPLGWQCILFARDVKE